jgi:phage-related baseplate assembly protein
MSLPEPSFIERDATKITQELIAQYETMTGRKLYPAQVERLIVDLVAYREMLLRIGIQEAAKQNLVEYARFPMLDYLGELVGVARLPAQSARTTLRFTLSAVQTFDILIPAGTQIETKDGKYIFKTDSDTTIKAGQTTVDVTATCETAGAAGNGYIAGEINNILSPIAYVEKAENISMSLGGTDEESDDRLRGRIKEAPESFSNAGSKGAYRFHAMSAHQDIVDVAVTSPTPGQVNVYPLMVTGNPTTEMLTLVSDTLNAEKIRPLTDQVSVLSPAKVDFSITANVTLFSFADSGTVQETINSKLNEYIAMMKSKLGKDIIKSQIIALINTVYGVYKTELTSPAADTVLNENEWANCAGITINIVGSVNG